MNSRICILKTHAAMECYELGAVAFENENYYNTVNWMVAALDQLDIEGSNYTIFAVPVLELFANATAKVAILFKLMYTTL
jgi:hypothetical protein